MAWAGCGFEGPRIARRPQPVAQGPVPVNEGGVGVVPGLEAVEGFPADLRIGRTTGIHPPCRPLRSDLERFRNP